MVLAIFVPPSLEETERHMISCEKRVFLFLFFLIDTSGGELLVFS